MILVTASTSGRPPPQRRLCQILERRGFAFPRAARLRRRRLQRHLINLPNTNVRHRRPSRSGRHLWFRRSRRRCRILLTGFFRPAQRLATQFRIRQRAEAHRRGPKNIFRRLSPPIGNRNIYESGAAIGARACLPTFSPLTELNRPSRRPTLRLPLAASRPKPSSAGLRMEPFLAERLVIDGWSRFPRSNRYSKT